jgi:biotin carboxyl carrier protein
MSGKLVSYSVKVGDKVAVGDVLAVVEAMKMNTYVHAEFAGGVLELLAQAGDGVEEGQSLMRIG